MNCNELVKALYDKEIPSTWYSVNGLYKEDAYILRKIKKAWEVFSVDDYGNQNNDYVLFDNEQEACEYLYKKLLEMKQIR